MTTPSHSLPVPPHAAAAPDAMEVLRLWQAGGQHHVSLTPRLEGTAENFGAALAQIALHSAGALSQQQKLSHEDTLRRIIHGFKNEIARQVKAP